MIGLLSHDGGFFEVPKRLEVIDGGRAQLEEKIVEDIFLNRYDPSEAAPLKRRGRLVAVPISEVDR